VCLIGCCAPARNKQICDVNIVFQKVGPSLSHPRKAIIKPASQQAHHVANEV